MQNSLHIVTEFELACETSVSPRSSPPGTFRETSSAAKSKEKRMFSQAKFEPVIHLVLVFKIPVTLLGLASGSC